MSGSSGLNVLDSTVSDDKKIIGLPATGGIVVISIVAAVLLVLFFIGLKRFLGGSSSASNSNKSFVDTEMQINPAVYSRA